jgi:hypothetical protein
MLLWIESPNPSVSNNNYKHYHRYGKGIGGEATGFLKVLKKEKKKKTDIADLSLLQKEFRL